MVIYSKFDYSIIRMGNMKARDLSLASRSLHRCLWLVIRHRVALYPDSGYYSSVHLHIIDMIVLQIQHPTNMRDLVIAVFPFPIRTGCPFSADFIRSFVGRTET